MSTQVHSQERRSHNTAAWIEGICRQFSDAIGWELEYSAVDDETADRDLCEWTRGSDYSWHTEINDGHRPIGRLQIELPDSSSTDRNYLAVCNLAEVIAQLVSRLAAAERTIDRRTCDLSTLVDIGLSVNKDEGLGDALEQLLRAAVQLTNFRCVVFFLLDPTTNELNLKAAHHIDQQDIRRPSRSLQESSPDLEALATGTVVVQRQASAENDTWLPKGIATGVCLPVQSSSGPIGTLWVYDRRIRPLSDRETHVLESLSAQIASILERVALLKESEAQLRLQRELQFVSENQTRDYLGQLSQDATFEVASRCRSRFELGGDLCELIPVDACRTLIAIGDAAGTAFLPPL